jgi:hypothetical protein
MTSPTCAAPPRRRIVSRTTPRLAIGLAAAMPLAVLTAAIVSAYPMMPGGSVQSGADASGMWIHITSYTEGVPFRCEVTFDNNADPTVGGDSNHGILNFDNLPASSSGYKVAHLTCHTGKNFETPWSLPDQPVPGATS